MKYLGIRLLVLLMLFTATSSFAQSRTLTSREIVTKMLAAIKNVKTLKYKLKKTERLKGKYLPAEQDVKMQMSPRKSYAYVVAPTKGIEVLYVEGQNDGDAIVNPNGFPYVSLELDPMGSNMRKNNHHTVFEMGFDYIGRIIADFIKKAGADFSKHFIYEGDIIWNNRNCYKLIVDYPQFKYIPYIVKKGETLPIIADRLMVSDYMILEVNCLTDYNAVKEGQKILVPTAYARKTILYIDKQNFLPIRQEMHDDKGLYARYEFYNVQVNPVIAPEEFTKGYKDYDF